MNSWLVCWWLKTMPTASSALCIYVYAYARWCGDCLLKIVYEFNWITTFAESQNWREIRRRRRGRRRIIMIPIDDYICFARSTEFNCWVARSKFSQLANIPYLLPVSVYGSITNISTIVIGVNRVCYYLLQGRKRNNSLVEISTTKTKASWCAG